MNKFQIEFQVNGIDYSATVENYYNPGNIKVTDIKPVPVEFPKEILLIKNGVNKIVLDVNAVPEPARSQIIEAVDRTALEKGIKLF